MLFKYGNYKASNEDDAHENRNEKIYKIWDFHSCENLEVGLTCYILCKLVKDYQCFGVNYCIHLQGRSKTYTEDVIEALLIEYKARWLQSKYINLQGVCHAYFNFPVYKFLSVYKYLLH